MYIIGYVSIREIYLLGLHKEKKNTETTSKNLAKMQNYLTLKK